MYKMFNEVSGRIMGKTGRILETIYLLNKFKLKSMRFQMVGL